MGGWFQAFQGSPEVRDNLEKRANQEYMAYPVKVGVVVKPEKVAFQVIQARRALPDIMASLEPPANPVAPEFMGSLEKHQSLEPPASLELPVKAVSLEKREPPAFPVIQENPDNLVFQVIRGGVASLEPQVKRGCLA